MRVYLVTLGDPGRLTGGYLYHLRMAEAAPACDARVRFISFPDRRFPLPVFAGPSVLRDLARAAPDAVVLDSIAAAFLAPWASRVRAPIVASLHQPPGGVDADRLRAMLDRMAYRRCARLIAASEPLAQHLSDSGLPQERLRVVPPGRDVALAPGESVGDLRRGRRCSILCVANWVHHKGILELLDSVAMLPDDYATLHLVGDDGAEPSYAARVQARIASADLNARVVAHGRRSREDVLAFYRAADVFALPSYSDAYGTVWGEAMAEGLPVVGWRAENLPWLALDGREALMAEPGDVAGLAKHLQLLCEDEALRKRIGEAARARADTRPTWAESAALFFDTVRETVATTR